VGVPLVLEEARIGIDISIEGRVGGAGGVAAALGMPTVVGLRPEAVEDKREVLGALGATGVGGAELRRPGKVEKVEVEGVVAGRGGETSKAFPIGMEGVGSG